MMDHVDHFGALAAEMEDLRAEVAVLRSTDVGEVVESLRSVLAILAKVGGYHPHEDLETIRGARALVARSPK